MRGIWTPVAKYQRAEICDHITANDPRADGCMNTLSANIANHLAVFPERGKPAHLSCNCELFPHEHYRLAADTVYGARQWPPPLP